MSVAESEPKSLPRKRRRFQYSVRTLLVVLLLASIGLSWLGVRLRRAERQREVVEAMP